MTPRVVLMGMTRRAAAGSRRPALGCRGWGLGFVAAVLLGLSWGGMGHGPQAISTLVGPEIL